jgi:hypothetical protein
MLPGEPAEGVQKRTIECSADSAGYRTHRVEFPRTGIGKAIDNDDRDKAGPLRGFIIGEIGVGLNAEHGPAYLIIESDLTAANQPGGFDGSILEAHRDNSAISSLAEILKPIRCGPRAAQMAAEVETRPAPYRRRRQRRFQRQIGGERGQVGN